jgi:L-gulono-1,4-lactone dehydrogenase
VTATTTSSSWRNWAGSLTCRPREILRPTSLEGLRAGLRAAPGAPVRPVGSGHSFAPLCPTDGLLVDLSRWQGVEHVDVAARRARVLAGTTVAALGAALAQHGLALVTQGDIDTPSVGGGLGTGTHGTGLDFGSYSSLAREIELLTADGELVTIGEDRPGELACAALSLGALGVLTRVTLDVVPAYNLRERTRAIAWDDDALGQWAATQRECPRAELYWVPAHDACVVRTLDETTDAPSGEEPGVPAPPGTIERHLTPERVDASHRVYPSIRTVPFVEMEHILPAAAGPAAFAALRDLIRTRFPHIAWTVEYRTQRGDALPLSPTQGEASALLSVHDDADGYDEAFFRAAESVLREHGGRPHWGKLTFLEPAELRDLYPQLDRFEALRAELDPRGRMLNAHLAALLHG